VREYLAGGVRLVWLVDPRERRVTVRYPDRPPRILATGGVLDGEDVVPGFSLPLEDLFGMPSS
jgi:Uma2 family endonuclease